jgi:hypothetical protein
MRAYPARLDICVPVNQGELWLLAFLHVRFCLCLV